MGHLYLFPYRRYVPELKSMPLKFLFQPWKAPQKVQEKASCIIGKDYPKPMVDHRQAAADCKRKMEEVKAILKDPSTYIHGFFFFLTFFLFFFFFFESHVTFGKFAKGG